MKSNDKQQQASNLNPSILPCEKCLPLQGHTTTNYDEFLELFTLTENHYGYTTESGLGFCKACRQLIYLYFDSVLIPMMKIEFREKV